MVCDGLKRIGPHRPAARWRRVIDPELLKYLLVDNGPTRRITPHTALLVVGMLTILAVAGPAWQREPSPFADAKPPVVVAHLEENDKRLLRDENGHIINPDTGEVVDELTLTSEDLDRFLAAKEEADNEDEDDDNT